MPKQGKNQEDIQHANRLTVLRMIHRRRCCSRAELARRTVLTKTTITGIVQNQIDVGVVRETRLLYSSAGRKSMGLMMCEAQHMSIGLRLTRRHLRGALCDLGGEAREVRECRIEPGAVAEYAVVAMEKMVEELLQSAGSRKVLGIGGAALGPIA